MGIEGVWGIVAAAFVLLFAAGVVFIALKFVGLIVRETRKHRR